MSSITSRAFALVVLLSLISPLVALRFQPKPKGPQPGLSFRASAPSESAHLRNVTRITNGGTNAEAYWSFDNKKLSFQAIRGPVGEEHPCDQIYTMNADGSNVQLVSTGRGRDTCAFFLPDGQHLLYSSTETGKPSDKFCPPISDPAYGYIWPIYKEMDIHLLRLSDGALTKLTDNDFYDAETTISPTGDFAVFTSTRDGDLEIYTMDLDGSNVRRLTYTPGYDGGPVISYDGKMIAWRASRPQGQNLTNYLNLLSRGLVEPSHLDLYVMTDLNNPNSVVQLTNNGAANFAPYFLPDDSGLIFSSDLSNPAMGEFHLYTIKLDGTGLTQITTEGYFNSFPMFSFDGKLLAWESDRNTTIPGEINVYVAEWAN